MPDVHPIGTRREAAQMIVFRACPYLSGVLQLLKDQGIAAIQQAPNCMRPCCSCVIGCRLTWHPGRERHSTGVSLRQWHHMACYLCSRPGNMDAGHQHRDGGGAAQGGPRRAVCAESTAAVRCQSHRNLAQVCVRCESCCAARPPQRPAQRASGSRHGDTRGSDL